MTGARPDNYFRHRITPTFFAHLFKGVAKDYFRELIPVLRPLIPEDAVVFDVGAHAGRFAKLFAKLAPRGTVYAVEPGTYARGILRVAMRLNRLRNVVILPFGLGDAAGIATLTVPVKRSGSYGYGLSHMGKHAGGNAEIELVPVATLDAVVEALKLDRLDFIKADIEGFEYRLVMGGRGTLARFRPALLLEMNRGYMARAGDSLETLWQALLDMGYRPYTPMVERTPHAAPFQGDVLWIPDEIVS
jgi:FkbM family methyltransferase